MGILYRRDRCRSHPCPRSTHRPCPRNRVRISVIALRKERGIRIVSSFPHRIDSSSIRSDFFTPVLCIPVLARDDNILFRLPIESLFRNAGPVLSMAVVSRLFYLQASNKHNPPMVCTVYSVYWVPGNTNSRFYYTYKHVFNGFENVRINFITSCEYTPLRSW